MTALKILAALLGAAACLIPYLALTEEYERDIQAELGQGRVLRVEDDVLRYEKYAPGSRHDDDGDGWVGPYSNDDIPSDALAALAPGDSIRLRGHQPELALAPPTNFLLFGFALCLLIGGLWVAQPFIERRQLAQVRHDPVEVIKLMLRRSRLRNIGAGLLLSSMGVLIALMAFADEGAETWQRAFLVGLGALASLLGVPSLLSAWRLRDVERAPALDLVLNHPEHLVWMYEHVVTVNGVHSYNLYLHAADGQRFDFALGDLPATALIDALRQRVPHALIGYSEERLLQWQRAPDCLLDSESAAFLDNAPEDMRPRAF